MLWNSLVNGVGPCGWGRAVLVALLVALSSCSRGSQENSEQVKPDVRVSQAHMRAMAPGRNVAAVYLKLENTTGQDLRLVEVSTPFAERAEVHRTTYQDGVMRMRQIEEVNLPAGQTLDFSPGGYHIMLMEVADPPEVGSRFDLQLVFEPNPTVQVSVEVRPVN